jgi:hypothetical protein
VIYRFLAWWAGCSLFLVVPLEGPYLLALIANNRDLMKELGPGPRTSTLTIVAAHLIAGAVIAAAILFFGRYSKR